MGGGMMKRFIGWMLFVLFRILPIKNGSWMILDQLGMTIDIDTDE